MNEYVCVCVCVQYQRAIEEIKEMPVISQGSNSKRNKKEQVWLTRDFLSGIAPSHIYEEDPGKA